MMESNSNNRKFQSAIDLCEKGDFSSAEPILRECVRENPKLSDAWRVLAQIDWMQHHDSQKAENELIEALRIDPKNIWALILMGNLLSKENKDVTSAKKYYDDVLKYYPDNNIALNNIAATLLQIDKTQESIPYFEKAIQANPKYLNSYYGLAMAYMKLNELDKAFDTTLKGLLLGKERVENPGVYLELQRQLLAEANDIVSKTDYHKTFLSIKKELEDYCGRPIIMKEDTSMALAGKLEYGPTHGRKEHILRYNPRKKYADHILVHELMHLYFQTSDTNEHKGKVIATTDENMHEFKRRYAPFFRKNHSTLPKDKVDGLMQQLLSGYVLQVMNCPLDLFIEDRIYNKYPELRPLQFLSLFEMEKDNLKSANDKKLEKAFPLEITKGSKVLNMVTCMHFKQLYGVDLLSDYHATKMEMDQATDLYEEYKAYIDTYKTGDEYELVEYFEDSLHMQDMMTIQPEVDNTPKDDPFAGSIKDKIADEALEALEISENQANKVDTDYENAKFALEHQDGADAGQTFMMAMYMLAALEYFENMPKDKIKLIAFEIAKVGITGIHPQGKYTLKSIPKETFGGWKLLAYYYVSWAIAMPEMLSALQLPFDKAYSLAKDLFSRKKNK